MKKVTFLAMSLAVIMGTSCSSSNEEKTEPTTTDEVAPVEEKTEVAEAISGKELYTAKGCVACHQLEIKTVGPSIKDIAAAYEGNKDGLIAFLKEEAEAIVDPAQAAVMKPQLAVTKALPTEELNAIVDYILESK
ncbi:MAG: cytochrome C552 [Flavobacteriales bacterium CG18_big_fil_WC_8_21_14_2_50_32_9]|nr:MAG: cytochrome C552 [Flavobacteriales bacterium CG18_big_fil_WC_8_21_14_2_50_32_9]PJC61644.1 MAG: cytochrome C552 [Flavobacteriales bacterium CG_4_9_14_0_2_um_filter_32_27]